MKPIMIVYGTRPEIIKMAPIIRRMQQEDMPLLCVHCGQHYDYEMSRRFIEDLELTNPDYEFRLKTQSQGEQTADILVQMERLLMESYPSAVLVEGDTNTVLAASLASVKLAIPVGHVEAGLRSFDLRMPEEHNRRLADHISTYLFAPTSTAVRNLAKESVWGKVFLTGNTVIDAVNQHMAIAMRKSKIIRTVRFDEFALATAHRAENVDDPKVLIGLMEAFSESPIPIVYPIHPRTKKRLHENRSYQKTLKTDNVQLLPPLGYLDFLAVMKNCKFIITDSGGIQEEATAPSIRKRVLVTRISTERVEAVKAGFVKVVGTEKARILDAIRTELKNPRKLLKESPYGDGNAAEKITSLIEKELDKTT